MTGFVEGADRWMGTLLAWELKGFALLALVAVGAFALRRGSAAGRHWVWLLGVTGLLALPFVQAVAPRWAAPLPVWATLPPGHRPTSTPDTRAPRAARAGSADQAPAPAAAPSSADAPGRATSPAPARMRTGARSADAVAVVMPTPRPGAAASARPEDVAPALPAESGGPRLVLPAALASIPVGTILLGMWMLGALALLGGVAVSLASTWLLEARTEPFPPGKVRTLTALMVRHLGIRRPVRLLRGEADAMPVSWGWLRPVVLLPAGAETWSRNRLAAVLLHEMAHVRRSDCLAQVLAEIAVALHWMNPLAWLAAARMRAEREYACDDLVLRSGARASDYADELLALARSFRADRTTPRAAVAMARPSSLGGRLRAVLDDTRRRRLGRFRAAAAGLMAVLLVTALAALTPTTRVPVALAPLTPDAPGIGVPVAVSVASADASPEPAAITQVVPTPQVRSCGMDTDGWKNVSNQSNDDRRKLQWSKPGCEVEVRVDGDIEFTSDFRDVARLDRDARLRIEETEGRSTRMLEISAGAGGQPSYEYRVDRDERAFDADARAWYEGMLLQVFRRAGFMAHERVAALLHEGGVPAVLTELDALRSDYVFATYTQELLKQATDISDAQALDVVRRARDRVDSDFYLSEILKAFATGHLSSNAMLDEYLGAAGRIDSDFYRSEVLKVALDRGGLSTDQVAATVAAASGMESDFYISEVLKAVAKSYTLSPAIRERYLEAVSSIDSDYYRSEVLGALMARNDLSSSELAIVLRAAGDMESDSYKDAVLERISAKALDSDELTGAYIDVASGIGSDHYRAQALGRLTSRDDLPDPQVAAVIRAAAGMDSDFYKAQVLTEVARRYHPQGSTREALVSAVDSIESSYYRGQVAELMIR